jgi:hypothetical protein
MLFHACPLLKQWSHEHETAFENFMRYKTRVPVCGAIMVNPGWDKVSLLAFEERKGMLMWRVYSVYLSKDGSRLLDGAFRRGRSIMRNRNRRVPFERFAASFVLPK